MVPKKVHLKREKQIIHIAGFEHVYIASTRPVDDGSVGAN